MASSALKLTKSEWRQVSHVAAQIDWARHSADRLDPALNRMTERTSAALHQLLGFM